MAAGSLFRPALVLLWRRLDFWPSVHYRTFGVAPTAGAVLHPSPALPPRSRGRGGANRFGQVPRADPLAQELPDTTQTPKTKLPKSTRLRRFDGGSCPLAQSSRSWFFLPSPLKRGRGEKDEPTPPGCLAQHALVDGLAAEGGARRGVGGAAVALVVEHHRLGHAAVGEVVQAQVAALLAGGANVARVA